MGKEIWIKFVPDRGKFGVKVTTYFGDEDVYYADNVDISTIFPAKPRPGVTKMNVSSKGIIMSVSEPFVLSGQMQGNKMDIRVHHEK
ncbi:MAG: hypothetical protein ACOC44_01610 [Promethearchaeia archaeon]